MFSNNKGMIGLVAAVTAIILTGIISITLLSFCSKAGSLATKQEENFQDYHNAALGADRGIWLLRQPAWMVVGGLPREFPYPAIGYETVAGTPSGTAVQMRITYDSGTSTYTIESISGNRTISASVKEDKIISWD